MPTILSNGVELYYEVHGSGEPLLLIMGWAGNAATWKPQLPGLAKHYRVISFDNRGVGRSSAPDDLYDIGDMAADAVGLLDELGIDRAHVFGISMGGMIAQELALMHPERVDALILGCTSPGGEQSAGFAQLQSDIADFYALADDGGPDLQWFSEFLKRLWTDEALVRSDAHLQDFVFSLIRYPPTAHGMRNQAEAISSHDAFDRLRDIRAPTLVMTGAEDSLIDPQNSVLLAEGITNAELHLFAGLKHAFHLEQPERANALIVDFIDRVRRADQRAAFVAQATDRA